MVMRTQRFIDYRSTSMKRRLFAIVALMVPFLMLLPVAGAQQKNDNDNKKTSELAIQNFSRVAASAAEVKSILLKDSGLMVELKRWVAKDATDHGQIVSDSDLTDDAMFERLESDVQFRSVATLLVQRYGYLLPQVNPDSETGKERALLLQERTKWLAQHQEEDLAKAHQENTEGSAK